MTPSVSPYLECNIAKSQRAVIEAAAGTGKTYNITNIVARIIMEREDVSIDNMVIVTFTRAAAGELKTRISLRLAELEKAIHAPGEVQDELLQKAFAKGIEKKELQKRLRLALLNFDRAMIGTIHSFAMRALSEYSFNSKLQFEFTLNEGTPAIVSELCNDFWRSFFYDETNLPLKALDRTLVETYCSKRLADPELNIVWPECPIDDPLQLFKELAMETEMIKAEQQATEKERSILSKELKEAEKDRKSQRSRLSEKLQEIEKVLDECRKFITKDFCEQCFAYVKAGYERICREKNFLGNDDLILKMGDALENPEFAQHLQKQFPVGLIDEFQDTNDSQFKIFQKTFLENCDSTFLVVGDPRQAIYRFRNCDIKTYLDAKKLMCAPRTMHRFSAWIPTAVQVKNTLMHSMPFFPPPKGLPPLLPWKA